MGVKVSVVVCTYNQEKTIARTLDSILKQKTKYPYEIILGEDASTDGTRAICEKYASEYPDIIKLLPSAPNKGLMRNYRDCIKASSGEYSMACAGDDWWSHEGKIDLQVDFLENNPDYVLTYTGSVRYNVNRDTYSDMRVIDPKRDTFAALIDVDFICAPTWCFRISVFKSICLDDYIAKGYPMEDYPMLLEMSQLGQFKAMEELTVTYTHSSDSASTFRTLEKQVLFEDAVQRVRKDMVAKYGKGQEISDLYLDDLYHRTLYSHGIKFNDRKFSLTNILNVGNKTIRDYMKIVMALTGVTYAMLRRRNGKFATE